MPWRLIGFILLFGIFLVFIAFNLGNKCDINFGFRVFHEVPVFLTAFASFILGMLCAVPFIFSLRRKKKDKTAGKKEPPAALLPELSGDSEGKPRKKWGKQKETPAAGPDVPEDSGPYGIN
ncbi:MAG: hypothetical protein LBE14_06715 [Treponema sp.]|jgi:uncharacterized integral membrane protein|nr:hypothetical protein [Treponema sp.]